MGDPKWRQRDGPELAPDRQTATLSDIQKMPFLSACLDAEDALPNRERFSGPPVGRGDRRSGSARWSAPPHFACEIKQARGRPDRHLSVAGLSLSTM
jgi:hypothetical protein